MRSDVAQRHAAGFPICDPFRTGLCWGSVWETEKAGAVWVIGVSAPAVVTGIYKLDEVTRKQRYRLRLEFEGKERAIFG